MKKIFSVLSIACLSMSAWAVDSLEDVISKHIKAKGGAQNWAKIKNMKITGSYTGFSITDDFTLYKAQPNHLYFDHTLNGRDMLIGYDGEQAWWFNGWMETPISVPLTGNDYKVMIQDAEFSTPFMNPKRKDLKITYKGEGDFDGEPTLVLEVERDEDHKETWHLNPESYLEFARVSPGSEFGRDITQTTIFDDFREVAGVKIPFYTETEFHTRHRVMEIAKVEVNTDMDRKLFSWPTSAGITPLQIMPGTWKVAVEERSRPDAPWQKSETTSEITASMRGHLFTENLTFGTDDDAATHMRQWSYDPFKKTYRVTQFNDYTTHMNIFEGAMADGVIKTDNTASKTPWSMWGRTFHEGLQMRPEGNGFVVEMVRSLNGGTNWFVNKRFTYTKP